MNKTLLTTGLLFTITLLSASCSSTRNAPLPLNPGASVQINSQFESLPNASRVYFQDGAKLAKGSRDQWRTYCELYVYDPDKNADFLASVAPGKFRVTNVAAGYESVGGGHLNRDPWMFASLLSHEHDIPSYILYKTGMRLDSSEQPHVQTLTCYRKESTYGNFHPTLAEIRQALGSVIEIDLNSI